MDRRLFLKALGATPLAYALPSWAENLVPSGSLATPDFSNAQILRNVAGLRPLRAAGVRLEVEHFNTKKIVHNYGHGGSGFTLAWGSAFEAAELVAQIISPSTPQSSVAVLGGGVIGLTTAQILTERGYRVRVYTAKMSPDTTSDLAGAQWSPSFISEGTTTREKLRYQRMVAQSYQRYESLAGANYGVHLRPNFIPDGFHDGLQDVAPGVLKAPQRLRRLPFRHVHTGGTLIYSWLIEPPIFMPALIRDLRQQRVEFFRNEFKSLEELEALPESVLVNCCGLGSRSLFGDAGLIPMKGQLVLLRNPLQLKYILLHRGYLFGRQDAIILGGSYERNNFDLRPDKDVAAKILKLNRDFFRV